MTNKNIKRQVLTSAVLALIALIAMVAMPAFAQAQVIVDNGEPGTSSTGTWKVSTGPNPYGGSSLYSNEAGATYTFQAAVDGSYEVSLWWTYYNNRCTGVPVEIYDGTTLLDTVSVNQMTNGAQWNVLGTYAFAGTARVVIISEGGCTTCADAVRFVPFEGVVLDNGEPGTSSTGTWKVSTGPNPYGGSSLYSNEAGATYTFEAAVDGSYEVSLWWTYYNNRCTGVPVEIYDDNELLDTVEANQKTNGGQWNVLGTYVFSGTARVVIISEGECTTCADAVMFVSVAPPELEHVEIEGPQSVNDNSYAEYDCRAYYTNAPSRLVQPDSWEVVDCPWAEISAEGVLTTYDVDTDEHCQISVTYTEGITTKTAEFDITIRDYVPPIEVDNGEPGTSSTGTWKVSTGPNPYGGSSLYSNEAGATYTFEAAVDGSYEVSLWWTYYNNRCTGVPVEIYDDNELLDTVEANQKTNGGQWNVLGTYVFSGTARVVIISEGECTTCADAVMFVSVAPPELEHVEIEGPQSVNDNSYAEYDCRAYYTNAPSRLVQPDSWEVVDCPWAEISAEGVLTTYDVDTDEHCQISVTYTEGITTKTAEFDITIRDYVPPIEVDVDNGEPGTSSTGTWKVSTGPNPYGGSSLYSNEAGAMYTFEAAVDGSYEVSLWWTYYNNRCTGVPVEIYDDNELLDTVEVNQMTNGGQWNVLGTYVFSGTARVVIISEGGCTTCADAVRFVFIDEPFVKIVVPHSYYLQGHPDVSVRADAANLQTDWGIQFVLDIDTANPQSILDTTEPYEVVFTGLTMSEHTLDAFVVDDLGIEVPGPYTHDQEIQIGIGDYYVAIGDSITKGVLDDGPGDDTSEDGRNSGGGFEPILNDLLTMEKDTPHYIANEGTGGDTSADGVLQISTILANHPQAQYYLVQYGTNDAANQQVRSGKGLDPGDPGYNGTFKDNIQVIINAINYAGKEVCLAKVPVILADCLECQPYDPISLGEKNILIQEYNDVIDELLNDATNSITIIPPDFYGYFEVYYSDEYSDWLHPNGAGYRSMADLWFDSLTQ